MPKPAITESMLRYVILEHQWRGVHWDVMLQDGEILKTWELASPPNPSQPMLAQAKNDHRIFYLDYEGAVSDDRGNVRQWDSGSLQWQQRQADAYVAQLSGRRFAGALALQRQSDLLWQALFHGHMQEPE